jgi:hypothetical protein
MIVGMISGVASGIAVFHYQQLWKRVSEASLKTILVGLKNAFLKLLISIPFLKNSNLPIVQLAYHGQSQNLKKKARFYL